ncbi:hypothetical protein BH23ACT9_BH23ACT9_25500 [soil metagenome]
MDTHDIARLGLEQLLSIEDLAAYLDVPRQTIYDWRVDGRGPRALKIGKRLRFTAADVRAWVDAQAEGSPGSPAGSGGPAEPGR